MSIQEDKLKKVKALLEIATESLTRKEFIASFESVIKQVFKVEAGLIEKINKAILELKGDNNTLNEATESAIDALKADLGDRVAESLKEQQNGMNFIYDKMRRIKSGIDGKAGKDGLNGRDADPVDTNKLVKEVLDKVEIPELDTSILDKLKEDIEELKNRPIRVGGGFSKIHLEQKFIDDETPSGTINGTNKVFVIANIPNPPASVKVFNDGQRMKGGGEDYTLSGNTITYVNAPLANTIITIDYRK